MKKLLILAALALPMWAQTAVNDRLYLQSSSPWKGQITITWPAFTACDGKQIAKGSRTVIVTDGTIGITLWATDCAAPSFAYGARYVSGGNYAATWSEEWAIPSAPSIVTLAAVRTASTLKVFPSQIVATGLGDGTYCVNVVSEAATGLVACSGGGGGAVSSVAGRTGDVTLAKTDVGLGNVDNTADTSKPVSTAQQSALNLKADASALTAHTGNTSNPHSVTKAQVGLGSVDNTSDAGKPISTATQTALDLKAPLASPTFTGNATITGTVSVGGANAVLPNGMIAGTTVIGPAGVNTIPSALLGASSASQGYWDMWRKSDATHFADLSGQGNHAATVGGVTAHDYGVSFDGASGYLEVPANSLQPTPYETGAEIISNGTFSAFTGTADSGVNNTITGWTAVNGATAHTEVTTTAPSQFVGGYALKLKVGSAAGIARQTITVAESTQYGIGFWTRGDGTNAARFRVLDNSHGATNIIALTTTSVSGTQYKYYSVIFTTPVGCTSVIVDLYTGAAGTDWFYFSNVTVRKVYPVTIGILVRRDGDWHTSRQYVFTRLLGNNATSGGYDRVWSLRFPGNDQGTPGGQLVYNYPDNGTSAGGPEGGTGSEIGSTTSFESGVWHYAIVTWEVGVDNRVTTKMYVDGALQTTLSPTTWFPFFPGNAPLRIGATAVPSNEHYFLGTVGAAHVNRALFSAQNVTDATAYMRALLQARGLTPGW